MYFLYLDASGDPGKYVEKNTKYYVLAGLAMDPKVSKEASIKISEIMKGFFASVPSPPTKLHYSELIQHKHPYDKIESKELADKVFKILLSLDVTLFSIVIDKATHFKRYVEPAPVREYALELMTERFEWFLERKDDYGIMVADSEGWHQDKNLRALFEIFKKNGTSFKYPTRILDTIFFTPSETSGPLQLADFCAYSVFSKYERDRSNRFNQIKGKFNEYGLKEVL